MLNTDEYIKSNLSSKTMIPIRKYTKDKLKKLCKKYRVNYNYMILNMTNKIEDEFKGETL